MLFDDDVGLKNWISRHKVFVATAGLIGGWYLLGHLIHHLDKLSAIEMMISEVPEGSRVLNVGCKNWELFKDRLSKFEVTNIDIVPRDCPNFVLADVRDLSIFPDKFFSAVLASHVLEHLPHEDVGKAISEMNRVCEDPTKIYIVLPRWTMITTWLDPDHRWVPFF